MSDFPHRIERSSNRHSRAFEQDGTIVIRLARGLTLHEEETHVQNLLRRMTARLVRDAHLTTIDPFRPLLKGTDSLTMALPSGESIGFTLTPANRTSAKYANGVWQIGIGPRVRRAPFHRFLWKLLSENMREHVTSRVREINARTLRVPIERVRLGYASSQWGSCSRTGVIMLNASLLFLPDPLFEYVVIHELAHRLVPGHTPKFWDTVTSVCPDQRALRKELRRYRICRL